MKQAVVIGGTSGIGAGCAGVLRDKGWQVTVTGVPGAEVEAFHASTGIEAAVLDVRDTGAVQAFFDGRGPLDGLVNCAGILVRGGEYEIETFERVIDINLTGTMRCCLAAQPLLADTGGAIVNTASMLSYFGGPLVPAYSASKGGVVGMTLPIARDLAAAGVRVNTIAPGLIDTPIYGSGEASDKFKANLGQNVLFPKRLGVASELASMVAECITNDYMNGEVIRVDGGIRMPPK